MSVLLPKHLSSPLTLVFSTPFSEMQSEWFFWATNLIVSSYALLMKTLQLLPIAFIIKTQILSVACEVFLDLSAPLCSQHLAEHFANSRSSVNSFQHLRS